MDDLWKFYKDNRNLKIRINNYRNKEIEIITYSEEYYLKHWNIFKRSTDKKKISDEEFYGRLFSFLTTSKISESLVIIYLEDLDNRTPTIYELNKLLKRTSNQYPATFKQVKKLCDLGIFYLKKEKDGRDKQKIFINKDIAVIYGDEDFKKLMLKGWSTSAKEYIKHEIEKLNEEKQKMQDEIKFIKKGRRVKL